MGHDTHFLGRLDRVSDAHVERALTLYRDEALLKEVLNRAGLAEGVERLAISLDDPLEGPFVIVTRAGRFVTCLGKGMRVTKEPGTVVLSRERLDAAAAKVERMRERLAEIGRLARSGVDGVATTAIRRMADDGPRFCREDAETLIGVTPLVAAWVLDTLTQDLHWIYQRRREVGYLRFDRLKPHEEALARSFGRVAWRIPHLLVLADHPDVHEMVDRLGDLPEMRIDARMTAAALAFDLGTFTHATRALWLVGRRPRAVLRAVKRISDEPSQQARVFRELALGVIAMASQRVGAEARKALSRKGLNPPDQSTGRGWLDAWSETAGTMVQRVLDAPAEFASGARLHGRLLAAQTMTQGLELTSAQIDAIPDPVARAIVGVLPTSWLDDDQCVEHVATLAMTLPWIASASPADLFLPREHAQRLPHDPLRDVAQMVTPYAEANHFARPKPIVRKTEKLGRNDPCACGSGKKLKRCCGA